MASARSVLLRPVLRACTERALVSLRSSPPPSKVDTNPPLLLPLNLSPFQRLTPKYLHTGGQASAGNSGTQVHARRNVLSKGWCAVICRSGPRKPAWLAVRCPGSCERRRRVASVPGERGPPLLASPAVGAAGRRLGGGEAAQEAFPAAPTWEATRVKTACFLESSFSLQQNSPKVICRRDRPSTFPTGRSPLGFMGGPASPSHREPDLRSGAVTRRCRLTKRSSGAPGLPAIT